MPPGLWVTRILILTGTSAKRDSDQQPGKVYHLGRWRPGTRPIGMQLSPPLGMSSQPAVTASHSQATRMVTLTLCGSLQVDKCLYFCKARPKEAGQRPVR